MMKEIKITTLNAIILWETEKNQFRGKLVRKEAQDIYDRMEKAIDETSAYNVEALGSRGYAVYTKGMLPAAKLANLCAALAARILSEIGVMNAFLVGNVAEELFREMNVNENIQSN